MPLYLDIQACLCHPRATTDTPTTFDTPPLASRFDYTAADTIRDRSPAMTGVSPNVTVSKKRMARTYEEDGGALGLQLPTNRWSRRSSADNSALESTAGKESSASRASGTPAQMRDQDRDRDASVHQVEGVTIEGFIGDAGMLPARVWALEPAARLSPDPHSTC